MRLKARDAIWLGIFAVTVTFVVLAPEVTICDDMEISTPLGWPTTASATELVEPIQQGKIEGTS